MTTDPDSGRRLEAIVLAAGSGARFGGGKLSAPFQGRVLIEGALACAFAAPARSVFLTVGGDPDAVSAADRFAEQIGGRARLRIVDVADHAEGMGASLRAAARALPEDADGVFVF
ncbi:MAG: NTP transferase domain-containing protein, partial [Caulobacteraceae bacterium]